MSRTMNPSINVSPRCKTQVAEVVLKEEDIFVRVVKKDKATLKEEMRKMMAEVHLVPLTQQ